MIASGVRSVADAVRAVADAVRALTWAIVAILLAVAALGFPAGNLRTFCANASCPPQHQNASIPYDGPRARRTPRSC